LIIMALWIGLYPKPFFQILEQPVNQIVQNIHDKSNANAAVNAQVAPVPGPTAAAEIGSDEVGSNLVVSKPGLTAARLKASN
ncbi:MAG: hypothetical protein WCA47_00270, partial [Terriglobales bacterium]